MHETFTPPLKKFKTWSIPLTLMVLLFIGSCKKELLTNEAPNGELLHKAQLFYNQHSNTSTGLKDIKLATTTAIAGNRQKIAKFPPLWDKATTARTATGVSVISVPLAKFKLSNNEVDYERRVVFEEEDGEVTGGRITEVFAAPAAIKADGAALAIGSADPKSTGFSGSIIDYDLAYKQPRGRLYKNGQQAKGEVSVLPMPKGGFKALQPLGNKRSGSAKGGQSIAMGPENAISGFEPEFEDGDKNCDDIYLAYIEKDEYGNITFVEVLQFLYRICTGGPVGQQPPGGTSILVDCAEVVNGTAYINTDCQTCMGGDTGITECPPREIILDSTILNNAKIKCLLEKLLGKNGNTANPELMALLNAFVGKGFDVTFKIGTTKPESRGEASENTSDPTKYNIVLNTNKINSESQMSWVKTILHEAFHVNLLQKTYTLFGSAAINLWDKKPGEMSINELMDYTSMKATASGNPILKAEHHNFMAANLDIIKEGLKSFSLANNPTSIHNTFTDDHYFGLAYEGVETTSYYLNSVLKDSFGNLKTTDYHGTQTLLATVYYWQGIALQTQTNIPCN